jgi:hypothetical protein
MSCQDLSNLLMVLDVPVLSFAENKWSDPDIRIRNIKVWWHYLFDIFIIFNNHSHSTVIHSFILHHSPRPVFLYLHCFFTQLEKNLHGVPSRESNSGLPYSKPTHCKLSYAAPRLNYTSPKLIYAAPKLSYAAPKPKLCILICDRILP